MKVAMVRLEITDEELAEAYEVFAAEFGKPAPSDIAAIAADIQACCYDDGGMNGSFQVLSVEDGGDVATGAEPVPKRKAPASPMADTDWRPDTRARVLMSVTGVRGGGVDLIAVGDATTCAHVLITAPEEVLASLIGRWVWLLANWGGECKIERWVDVPKWGEAKEAPATIEVTVTRADVSRALRQMANRIGNSCEAFTPPPREDSE